MDRVVAHQGYPASPVVRRWGLLVRRQAGGIYAVPGDGQAIRAVRDAGVACAGSQNLTARARGQQ